MKEIQRLEDGKIITETIYDNSTVLELNKAQRNSSNEFGRYKSSNSGLVHIGRIDEGDVVRLHNMGYSLYTSDREELKRTLLYIQRNEPHLLTVPGKPIAEKKLTWV